MLNVGNISWHTTVWCSYSARRFPESRHHGTVAMFGTTVPVQTTNQSYIFIETCNVADDAASNLVPNLQYSFT